MEKKKFKGRLNLNKSVVSKLDGNKITGGATNNSGCPDSMLICGPRETIDVCNTNNNCETQGPPMSFCVCTFIIKF